MMSVLIVHLSDAHLKSATDPLVVRLPILARAVASEFGQDIMGILIAFTGDAVDKGRAEAFDVAAGFFKDLKSEIKRLTACDPDIIFVPGNHDIVQPSDPALRDLAIANLGKGNIRVRPQSSIEKVILEPLERFSTLVKDCAGEGLEDVSPYYLSIDKTYGTVSIRLHLLNTAWMCTRGQKPGDLIFPISEISSAKPADSIQYEITLLHHPYNWFRQPEIMRDLRDRIEERSDMVLTGHEHVGRSLVQKTFGKGEHEYHEGEALQDGENPARSGFHMLRLDFAHNRQTLSTYMWKAEGRGGAYVRELVLLDEALNRNETKISVVNRLRPRFEARLNDPELPVQHPKHGKLTLGEFFRAYFITAG
jgi:predicted MPP superfamily phosphohydrolase